MSKEIIRIYHPFTSWEDHQFGMYEKKCFMDEMKIVKDCELLLKCPEFFYESATYVTHHWKNSAEHNLTNLNRNRQAWIGQASCCLTNGAPEYLTKIAWNNLTLKQQEIANKIADDVILDWENKHLSGYFS